MKVTATDGSKTNPVVMQLTVTKTEDGFAVDTRFADGYNEEGLLDVVEMWADRVVDGIEERSPGWGKL